MFSKHLIAHCSGVFTFGMEASGLLWINVDLNSANILNGGGLGNILNTINKLSSFLLKLVYV